MQNWKKIARQSWIEFIMLWATDPDTISNRFIFFVTLLYGRVINLTVSNRRNRKMFLCFSSFLLVWVSVSSIQFVKQPWNHRKWYGNFLGKLKLENCLTSHFETSEIPVGRSNGLNISANKCSEIRVLLEGLSALLEICLLYTSNQIKLDWVRTSKFQLLNEIESSN